MPSRLKLGLFGFVAGIFGATLTASAGQYKVYTTYLWHLEQPIYWPEKVANQNRYQFAYDSLGGSPTYPGHPQNNLADIFGLDDRKAAYQFRPRDAVASMSGADAGAQLSYAGVLIENVWSLGDHNSLGYGPTWFSPIREAMGWKTTRNERKLDPIGFSYHHGFMPLLDSDTRVKEMAINKEIWWKAWNGNPNLSDHPKGFRCSEEAFSERIIKDLVQQGYEWVIVPNHHLSRCHPNYTRQHGSGVYDPPNKADQINANNTGGWFSGTIDGRGSTESVPFSFQAHRAKYVDPATGTEYSIIVVPMTDLGSYRDGYSAQGLELPNLLNSHANNAQPCLALFSHDGDNAWGGGFSYYMEAVPNFTAQAAGAGYRPTTIQTFLDENPPPANDIVHVEDGAWFNAADDWGHPAYVNWLWPPQRNRNAPGFNANDPATYADIENGWAEDFRNWAVIVAAQNFVSTAEQIHEKNGGSVANWRIQEPVQRNGTDNGANDAEKAWHFFLGSLDSGYMYYGGSLDLEVKPSLACNQAISYAQNVINAHAAGDDETGPTVFNPQRYPWNPGSTNYGAIIGYRTWVAPSDFHIWTLAYDLAGVTSCVVKVRADLDGFNPLSDNDNETYAGGAGVGAWGSFAMNKRAGSSFATNLFNDPNINFFITPSAVADEYWYKVTGYHNVLLDYYVEAYDARGNVRRSDIQHVFVGAQGGGTPVTFSPAAPSQCTPLVTTYNPAGRALSNASPVKLHVTFDNFATPASNHTMSALGGTWVFTNTIPGGATNAVVYFSDSAATTLDNNSNANWNVAIATCVLTYPSAVAFDPAQPNGCSPVSIVYSPNDGPLATATQVHIHVGRNGWQDVATPDPAMTKVGTNWTYTASLPPGTVLLNCVFNNGAGVWDNHGGQDWAVSVQNCSGQTQSVIRMAAGSPVLTDDPAGQNGAGDNFDFDQAGGDAVTVDQGGFGSFGHVYINYDATNLYLGGTGLNPTGSNNAFVIFLGLNTLGDDRYVLWSEAGAPNGVDQLHNLQFSAPMDLAILIGDEYGDGSYPHFGLGGGQDFGQGAYYLSATSFLPVAGAKLSQFDGTTTNATVGADDDGNRETDRWECALPLASLNASNIAAITNCRLAGVICGGASGNDRYLSGNYLGASATNTAGFTNNFGFTFVTLTPLSVGLPNPDSDGDGIPDDWELRYFGGPTNCTASADNDGDGFSNAQENLLGTHPGSASSLLEMVAVSNLVTGFRQLTWQSVGGKTYAIEASDVLAAGFSNLTTIAETTAPEGTGATTTFVDTTTTNTVRHYRVRLAP